MKIKHKLRSLTTLGVGMTTLAVLLSGCSAGGSSGGTGGTGTPPPPSAGVLSGVVAKGNPVGSPTPVVTTLPITGATVNVKCAAGTYSTTTDTNGYWTVTLTSGTLPCVAESSFGSINGGGVPPTIKYHGIATAAGVLNLTPLTDLVVSNVTGQSALSTWFGSVSSSSIAAITSGQVSASIAVEATALNTGPLTVLGAHNPMTVAFVPVVGEINSNLLNAYEMALFVGLANDATTMNQGAAVAGFTVPSAFTTALAALSALPAGISTSYYDYYYNPTTTGLPASTATILDNGANVTTGSITFGVSPQTTAQFYAGTAGNTHTVGTPIVANVVLGADTVDTLEPAVDMICQTVNSATTATDVIVSKNALAITTAAGLANMTFTHHQLNCADIGTANASTDSLTFDASGNLAGVEEGTSVSLTAAQVTSLLGGTPNTNGMVIQAYVLSGHTYIVFNRAKNGTNTGSVHLYY